MHENQAEEERERERERDNGIKCGNKLEPENMKFLHPVSRSRRLLCIVCTSGRWFFFFFFRHQKLGRVLLCTSTTITITEIANLNFLVEHLLTNNFIIYYSLTLIIYYSKQRFHQIHSNYILPDCDDSIHRLITPLYSPKTKEFRPYSRTYIPSGKLHQFSFFFFHSLIW